MIEMTNVNSEIPDIMGFNKTSEAGFDVFASSIFLFGCNMRCPYCMNGRLVIEKKSDWKNPVKKVDINLVKNHVLENNVEWVMISGGEPLLTPEYKLKNLLDMIASWGCKIGISTNGTNPDKLNNIIDKINYIALDLKSSRPSVYEDLEFRKSKKEECFHKFLRTKSLLVLEKQNREDFTYELRTTLYPAYFNLDSVDEIGGILRSDEVWVFQQFRHAKNMLYPEEAKQYNPYSNEYIEEIVYSAKKYCDNVMVRYV